MVIEGGVSGFLSTPSVWRVTPAPLRLSSGSPISIHTLRVEGDAFGHILQGPETISIHTLRVEGDFIRKASTHGLCISIHTLRVEGDYPDDRI